MSEEIKSEEIKNQANLEETTESLEDVLEATKEVQDLNDSVDNANSENNFTEGMDDLRSSFYHAALNLFEAAKYLKKYDILYTDALLAQAHYFLNLADNKDMLNKLDKASSDYSINKISKEIPDNVLNNIEKYQEALKTRIADVSEKVSNDVDKMAQAIQKDLEE